MLSISHSLTGGFIAYTLPHPALYIPLTLASHYLEDFIPHWDVGTGLSNGKRSIKTAIILEIGELIISVALLFAVFQLGKPEIMYHIWLGAFIGLLPDFLEAPRNFLRYEPKFLKPLNDFHNKFHNSVPDKVLGLAPQLLLWGFIYYFV